MLVEVEQVTAQKPKKEVIFRFFGPVPKDEASWIADKMLGSKELVETLERFLRGDIEPRELAYEIQVLAENAEVS